jgi:hypothetical protein
MLANYEQGLINLKNGFDINGNTIAVGDKVRVFEGAFFSLETGIIGNDGGSFYEGVVNKITSAGYLIKNEIQVINFEEIPDLWDETVDMSLNGKLYNISGNEFMSCGVIKIKYPED